MKKILVVLFAVVTCISCSSPAKGPNGVTYKSPVEYNNYIISRQTTLLDKIMNFASTAQTNLDEAGKLLDGYVLEATTMINEIKGMPAFRKDSAFRDAAVNSFSFYRKAFDEYYRDIIRIRKENAPDAEVQLDKVVNKLSVAEEKVDNAFHHAQKNFADKNKMKLKDNEMQKKIDNMN